MKYLIGKEPGYFQGGIKFSVWELDKTANMEQTRIIPITDTTFKGSR